ncbi:hypothetical protein COOONC_05318 [Cooperia oncophora]
MARGSKRKSVEEGFFFVTQDMPLWATKMIEKYESCCERIEKVLISSFEKLTAKVAKIDEVQESILSRLNAVEASIEAMKRSVPMTQNALYSTIVKIGENMPPPIMMDANHKTVKEENRADNRSSMTDC